ncbi:MAG: nucleotidyltransferase domain-containing protein [Nanoarchaeota archaeon]
MSNLTYNKLNVKQRILRFLIENKEKTFSMYELSKYLKIDYKLLYLNVKKLEKDNIMIIEDFKNQKRCSFKNGFNEDVFIIESARRSDFLKKKEFRSIYLYLKEINQQFIVLFFGSHVKGTATKHSDIDLLLVSHEDDAKKVEEKLAILPFDVHLTSITSESFIRMLKSKEFTVVSEALKKNVILFGIEDYYRLIQNAK